MRRVPAIHPPTSKQMAGNYRPAVMEGERRRRRRNVAMASRLVSTRPKASGSGAACGTNGELVSSAGADVNGCIWLLSVVRLAVDTLFSPRLNRPNNWFADTVVAHQLYISVGLPRCAASLITVFPVKVSSLPV